MNTATGIKLKEIFAAGVQASHEVIRQEEHLPRADPGKLVLLAASASRNAGEAFLELDHSEESRLRFSKSVLHLAAIALRLWLYSKGL